MIGGKDVIELLSNQMIQKAVQDIKRIAGLECSIWNVSGECLAMSSLVPKTLQKEVIGFLAAADGGPREEFRETGSFFLANDEGEPAYVLVILGGKADAEMPGAFGISQLESLIVMGKEKMDKNRFVQSLILGNMSSAEIYNQAKKMKIAMEQKRAVFLVEPKNEGENLILETLKGLYAAGSGNFLTTLDKGGVILVRTLEKSEDAQSLNLIAKVLVDTLNMEAMIGVRVAYGAIVEDLSSVKASYREADIAMEVGKVFYGEKNILAYNELGIGRLIHQLPAALCEVFLKEVFAGNAIEQFDEEELATVYTFFNNNLNISETARQLYVHRNTLVYRLEKIQKKTGLDVRAFDDALIFKIAMMVENRLDFVKKSKE